MFALKQRFKAEVLAVLNSNRNGYFYEVPGTWRALFYFIFKLMLGTGTECDVNRLQDSVRDAHRIARDVLTPESITTS